MQAFSGLYMYFCTDHGVTHLSDLLVRLVLGSSVDAWFASGACSLFACCSTDLFVPALQ